jgi:hypothetical protein
MEKWPTLDFWVFNFFRPDQTWPKNESAWAPARAALATSPLRVFCTAGILGSQQFYMLKIEKKWDITHMQRTCFGYIPTDDGHYHVAHVDQYIPGGILNLKALELYRGHRSQFTLAQMLHLLNELDDDYARVMMRELEPDARVRALMIDNVRLKFRVGKLGRERIHVKCRLPAGKYEELARK